MHLSSDLIPPLTIAIPFLYSGWLWLRFRQLGLQVWQSSYVVFAVAMLLQGILYLTFFLIEIPPALRGFWVRISFLNIALSFAIPLTIQLRERAKWIGK